MQHNEWFSPFLSLDLCGGELVTIENDGEDMLEIRWPDGMWVDVGYFKYESTYCITTVPDDTIEGWNHPLSVVETTDRQALAKLLQEEIFRCRKRIP